MFRRAPKNGTTRGTGRDRRTRLTRLARTMATRDPLQADEMTRMGGAGEAPGSEAAGQAAAEDDDVVCHAF